MKKTFRYMALAAMVAATIGLTGCSDYLDVDDESSVSDANFPTNIDHVQLLLNSAYAGSHGLGLYATSISPR